MISKRTSALLYQSLAVLFILLLPLPAVSGKSIKKLTLVNSHMPGKNTYPEFVSVIGGCFIMGDIFGDGDRDEIPTHQVCLSSFDMSVTEVTVRQFEQFHKETQYITDAEINDGCIVSNKGVWALNRGANWRNTNFRQTLDHPVVCISWNDTNQFCNWLNKKYPAYLFRLPTEAEWEYSARSGGLAEKYPGGNTLSSSAWLNEDNKQGGTHPVGRKMPNKLGLYDMSGNAWEWVNDFFASNYYQKSPNINPHGPKTGTLRIERGGGWSSNSRLCRTSYRIGQPPNRKTSYLGFRVIKQKINVKSMGSD